jgi:hypothetical protein
MATGRPQTRFSKRVSLVRILLLQLPVPVQRLKEPERQAHHTFKRLCVPDADKEQNPPALQTDNFNFFYFCDLKRRRLHGVKPFKVPKIELLVSGIQAQTNLDRCYCSGPYCKLQRCLPDLAGLRPHS